MIYNYRATLLSVRLKMSIMLFLLRALVNSFSEARRQRSDKRVSSRRFLCGVFTRFIVEKLLSASADDTGKLLFNNNYIYIIMLSTVYIN